MSDPAERPPKSLGNQATGADLDSAAVDAVRSIGEQSTAGDIGSSVSDLKDVLPGFDGETDDVVDLEARYEFRGELGRGGMGEVLLALDRRLNRQVAIKRLKEDLETSRRAAQRFLVEAQSIAALNHFNIVQIFDYGRAIDGPFIVMEYVSGGTLADRLAAEPIEQSVAVDLVDQLCQALTVTHAQGVIHRDIKPSNVLMTTDGVPKLTDFGLARQESSDEGQTREGTLLGTLDYMPPEQRKDATSADVRSDLWSLGATFYQMVTGNSPRVIVLEEVPAALRTVLGTVLKLDPGDRYQTAEEFRSGLQLAQAGAPSKGATGLSNGECAHCGHISREDQKFCQECGGALEVDCLGCQQPIEVWRAFCSRCGADISEILKNERTTLEQHKRTIEDLRQGFRFADAITALEPLQVARHPLLHPFSEWATRKTEQIGQELTKWEAERNTLLETARVSFRERANRDTVQLLEQIPEPLRDGSVSDLLEQAQSRIDETRTLKQLINEAIAGKRMDGLLPHAERYAELSPTDGNALRLVTRLQQRQVRKQTTMLEEAKPRIAELANDLRYLEALALLNTVSKRIIADDGDAQAWVRTTRKDLQTKSEPLRRQWVELEKAAAAAFSAGDYDRVIELLEQVPKLARQARSSRNLKEAAIRKTRVEELRLEISREETTEDCSILALLVEEYLRLKPNDKTMSAARDRVDKWLTDLEQEKRQKHKQQQAQTATSTGEKITSQSSAPMGDQHLVLEWPGGNGGPDRRGRCAGQSTTF
jgi:serine/threonine protein kinase